MRSIATGSTSSLTLRGIRRAVRCRFSPIVLRPSRSRASAISPPRGSEPWITSSPIPSLPQEMQSRALPRNCSFSLRRISAGSRSAPLLPPCIRRPPAAALCSAALITLPRSMTMSCAYGRRSCAACRRVASFSRRIFFPRAMRVQRCWNGLPRQAFPRAVWMQRGILRTISRRTTAWTLRSIHSPIPAAGRPAMRSIWACPW